MSSVLADAIRAGAHPALPRVGHKVAPFLSILLREPPFKPLYCTPSLYLQSRANKTTLCTTSGYKSVVLSQSIHFTLCSLLMLRLPFTYFRVLYICRKLFSSYEPMLSFITEKMTFLWFLSKLKKCL